MICLATGNYGTFTGTNKAVTITKQDGATPAMAFSFGTGDRSFTLDGMTITSGAIAGNSSNYSDSNNPKDITVKNSTFTGGLRIEYIANANILFDSNTHNNIDNNSDCTAAPGRIWFPFSSSTPTGVTIRNSLLDGGNTDGIQAGTGFTAINNEFRNIEEKSSSDCAHTDAIQLLWAPRSVLRGNYIHDSSDGIVAYDGVEEATIECNVVDVRSGRYGIELYADDSSIVRGNTFVKRSSCAYSGLCGIIELNHKSTDPAGVGTIVKDNIVMGGINLVDGSAAASNRNNMLVSGASGSNFNGTPIFVGGSNPTSWAGYFLASNSPGLTGAIDGGRVGIRNF